MSIQNNVPSEYTCMEMVLVKKDDGKKASGEFMLKKVDTFFLLENVNN